MNLFSFIKSQLSILDVISAYTTLKKAGHYWKGHCPFHSERTGSFTVSPHKEIFYCFGCHLSGDSISFIAKMENCSPLEAAKFLVERYHLNVPANLSYQEQTHEKKRYFDLCEQIALWCHEKLKKDPAVLAYLKKREISSKSMVEFTLGYFPGGLNGVKQFLHDMNKHAILADDLIDAHILFKGKNILYSPFEERIIFPIKDHLGRFCGFGGRTFKEQDTRAKYYNTHENEYFAKGALLFGLDRAKKEVQKQETVFLVEGYTDCIAMVQQGFINTVATLGTACTLEHLKILSRYAQELFLVYDGDKAGQEAILRIASLCWEATIDLKVITLPPEDDPASFLQKKKDLSPYIAKAEDIFLFFIQRLGVDFAGQPLSKKLSLTRKIIDIIQKIEDPLKRDLLLQKAAKTVDIPFDSLKNELLPVPAPKEPIRLKEPTPEPPCSELGRLEKKVFCAILQNIALLTRKNNVPYLVTFLPEPLPVILKLLYRELEQNPTTDFIQFFELLSTEQKALVSKLLLEEEQEVDQKEFEYLLLQVQKKHWKVIVNNIKIKIEQAKSSANHTRVQELIQEFLELRKNLIDAKTYAHGARDTK